MMTRRGLKGEAPPARHHRAIADAPPVFFNYPHASAIFIWTVFFKTVQKVNESYDLLETSRGPEARQREGALEVSVFLILCGAC